MFVNKEELIKDYKERGLHLSIQDLLNIMQKDNDLNIKTIDGELYYSLNNTYESGLFYYTFKDVFILRNNLFYYYENLRIKKSNIVHIGIPQ